MSWLAYVLVEYGECRSSAFFPADSGVCQGSDPTTSLFKVCMDSVVESSNWEAFVGEERFTNHDFSDNFCNLCGVNGVSDWASQETERGVSGFVSVLNLNQDTHP